ncbi:hypothetical protein OH76DRAFT_897916 [Lentinus brumalis]|uniref:Uncharacterized protein n=1 Tax=Lentinus brumalis TaxID=2498619 RepID=A0A371D0S2_9APHY|nr:hypothetical protein OH76DRAFT_897916 [Polyporus brumalis]
MGSLTPRESWHRRVIGLTEGRALVAKQPVLIQGTLNPVGRSVIPSERLPYHIDRESESSSSTEHDGTGCSHQVRTYGTRYFRVLRGQRALSAYSSHPRLPQVELCRDQDHRMVLVLLSPTEKAPPLSESTPRRLSECRPYCDAAAFHRHRPDSAVSGTTTSLTQRPAWSSHQITAECLDRRLRSGTPAPASFKAQRRPRRAGAVALAVWSWKASGGQCDLRTCQVRQLRAYGSCVDGSSRPPMLRTQYAIAATSISPYSPTVVRCMRRLESMVHRSRGRGGIVGLRLFHS